MFLTFLGGLLIRVCIIVFLRISIISSSSGILLTVSGVYAENYYDILGVSKKAKNVEIKKAYRQRALEYHPDKQAPNATEEEKKEAESKFRKVAEAYEVLSDDGRRRSYDAGGYRSHVTDPGGVSSDRNFGGFGAFTDPFDLFNQNFGDALWKRWSPGMTVQGTLVRGGKKIELKIFPNGTSEESEHDTKFVNGYKYVSFSDGDGSSTISIQISGDIGGVIAEYVLPEPLKNLPVIGPLILSLVSLLPWLLCCGCIIYNCSGPSRGNTYSKNAGNISERRNGARISNGGRRKKYE